MTDVVLRTEIGEDGVAVVSLARAQARNSLNAQLLRELDETIQTLDAREDVGAIVLTGDDPVFCAGLDLRALEAGEDLLGPDADERGRRGPFPEVATPVIAAVNGAAVTGGLEIVLACDFVVASERARFADTHARIGIQPLWGLTFRLPEAVGLRRAREMSATGRFVDAATALTWGLVNHVVAHEALVEQARALAVDVADNDRAAVARVLRTYEEMAGRSPVERWAHEGEVGAAWLRDHVSAASVGSRRDAVTSRGRQQNAG